MSISNRMHGRRLGGVFLGLAVAGAGLAGLFYVNRLEAERNFIRQTLDTLQTSSGESVAANIEGLRGADRKVVIPDLQRRYREARGASEKLSLAFALAEFDFEFSGGVPVVKYLVSQLEKLEPKDTGNMLIALGHSRRRSLEEIEAEAGRCEELAAYRRRAILALAAFGLGDSELAAKLMGYLAPGDYGVQSEFIEQFRAWQFDVSELCDVLQRSSSPALRAAVLLGLGQKPKADVPLEDRSAIEKIVERWLFEAPESSVHGAAKWLLQKWEVKGGTDDGWRSEKEQLAAGRSWFVNSQGTTMALVRPPVQGGNERGQRAFWIASTETSRRDFERFVRAKSEVLEVWQSSEFVSASPTGSHPMVNVTWFDAVRYCNWLSEQEGRTAAYRLLGNEGLKGEQWELIDSANGYRLPLEWEWELACRAGSVTRWSIGDDKALLDRYCQMFAVESTGICGVLLPNPWGLHDMHGNVQEWCSDNLQMPQFKGIRGGAWDVSAETCASAARSEDTPAGRTTRTGFRVALTAVEQ